MKLVLLLQPLLQLSPAPAQGTAGHLDTVLVLEQPYVQVGHLDAVIMSLYGQLGGAP